MSDWIKMRVDLAADPAVLTIAERLGMDERAVVGHLHALWSWAWVNSHSGNADVTLSALQRICGLPELPGLLVEVGWLEVLEIDGRQAVRFPNWDRHNSQTAKQRALTAARVAAGRARQCNAPSVTGALPDRDREKTMVHGPWNTQTADHPDHRKAKKSRKSAGRKIRTAVEAEVLAPLADRIFRACKYQGENGGNLWGVAALFETGKGDLTEAEIFGAARGAALNGRDKPAHFYATLSAQLAERGEDLTARLREITILPAWPKTRPYPGPGGKP